MSDDAMKALDEIGEALGRVVQLADYGHPGNTPEEDLGDAGRVAERALSLLPTLRAALTPPANQIRALQDAIEGECDGISVSERSACNILSYIGARAALTPPADDEIEAIRAAHEEFRKTEFDGTWDSTMQNMGMMAKSAAFVPTLLRALDAERQRRVEVEDNARLLVRDEHGFLVPRKETP